jgi:hypothetical protein
MASPVPRHMCFPAPDFRPEPIGMGLIIHDPRFAITNRMTLQKCEEMLEWKPKNRSISMWSKPSTTF